MAALCGQVFSGTAAVSATPVCSGR
ncbi:MAG: hypothetical protein ACK5AN_03100 [Planctomyces sp.]